MVSWFRRKKPDAQAPTPEAAQPPVPNATAAEVPWRGEDQHLFCTSVMLGLFRHDER